MTMYCKVCGKEFVSKRAIKTHARVTHKMSSEDYDNLDAIVPDAVIFVWAQRPHLQEKFPEPGNMNKGYGRFKNFLEWAKTCGVRDYPIIREAFSSEGR